MHHARRRPRASLHGAPVRRLRHRQPDPDRDPGLHPRFRTSAREAQSARHRPRRAPRLSSSPRRRSSRCSATRRSQTGSHRRVRTRLRRLVRQTVEPRGPGHAAAAAARPHRPCRLLRRRHRLRRCRSTTRPSTPRTVRRSPILTHLNATRTPRHPGPRAVEIYLPLRAGSPGRTVGVLELYLSYAPINREVAGPALHDVPRPDHRARRAVPGAVRDQRLGHPPSAPTVPASTPSWPSTTRSPACPTARCSSTASAALQTARRQGERDRDRGPRPGSLQGDQRHARPSQRRRGPHRNSAGAWPPPPDPT